MLWRLIPKSVREILEAPYRRDARIAVQEVLKNENKSLKILDAGAGDCFAKNFFKGRNDEYIGIDVEPRCKEAQLGDVQDLDFKDESFDMVLSLEVLEYVSDTDRALKELRRVLLKDGVAIISTPLLSAGYCGDRLRWTSPSLRSLVEKAGFEVLSLNPMGGYYRMLGWQISKLSYKIKKPKNKWFWSLYYLFKIPIGLIFQIVIPLILFHLDWLDKEKRDTCGYVVVAYK